MEIKSNNRFNFKNSRFLKAIRERFIGKNRIPETSSSIYLNEEGLYTYTSDGKKIYSKEAQDRFFFVTKKDYFNIRNNLNGVEILGKESEIVSLETRKEIWNDLSSQLNRHIQSLKELYPYCDFSQVYEKKPYLVYRIRFTNEEMNEKANQFNSIVAPLIGIHMEPQYNNDVVGLTALRHEFTHFCCNIDYDANLEMVENNQTIYSPKFPSILNEGLTQHITNEVLVHEHFDKESVTHGILTYNSYTKIAQIYMSLLGREYVINSYFKHDMSLINNAFISLVNQYPRYKEVINNDFIHNLNRELEIIHLYLVANIKLKNVSYDSIYNFNYFNRFMEFASFIFNKQPDYIIAQENIEKIKNIYQLLDEEFSQVKSRN